MVNNQLKDINNQLKVVVALLLRLLDKNDNPLSLREQINILNNLKVRPKDIAEIFGRDPRFINKEISFLKKFRKERKQNAEKEN